MNLRATLEDPAMRAAAAHRFAQRSVPGSNPELQQHLDESALRVLTLFAGADSSTKLPNGQAAGGFQAIAGFIDHSVPKGEQEKAAGLLLRMLEGATWDLWQLSRGRLGEADAQANARAVSSKARSTRYPTAFCMDRRFTCSLTLSSRCKLRYFS
jgi:cytochrome c biogenesis protein